MRIASLQLQQLIIQMLIANLRNRPTEGSTVFDGAKAEQSEITTRITDLTKSVKSWIIKNQKENMAIACKNLLILFKFQYIRISQSTNEYLICEKQDLKSTFPFI